jgi:hypothetical protein
VHVPEHPPRQRGFWLLEGLEHGKYRFYEYGSVDKARSPQLDKALDYLDELAGLRAQELAQFHVFSTRGYRPSQVAVLAYETGARRCSRWQA